MNQQDIRFIVGVLAHFAMDTSSITQRRIALQIINRIKEELNHD